MEASLRDDIDAILSSIIKLDTAEGVHRSQCATWDSMAQVALVSALEGEFDLALSLDDAMQLNTLDDCVELVNRYL
ncbi:phosphopantetheine-binding protein [Saccharospirillum alexandrii]|uniref:phosphopantetheine-binding protein n=1 Tax=Saccharospirillum alexandrii TaxID=2448477 RepID=UPI000FDCC451|nr:phosphopantetheine-binding protein [Saccharospirillum alexandrii]